MDKNTSKQHAHGYLHYIGGVVASLQMNSF